MFRICTSAPARGALVLVACFIALGASGAVVRADHHEKPKAGAAGAEPAKGGAAQDSAMAEMMKYAMPTPAHAKLEPMVGTWKAVSKSWNAPGQDPMVSEGTAVNRMVLGGRYLESAYKGDWMGQPFEGFGLTGYDVRAQQYESFWIDNMSTSMMLGRGAMDEKGQVLTVGMKWTGPDGTVQDLKSVTRIVDQGQHVYSMYGMVGGSEMLTMEITYTRK